MFKYKYSLGGYIFEIDSLYDYFVSYAKEYITDKESDYHITNTDKELDDWINNHKEDYPRNYQETLLIQTKVADILSNKDTFIIHGSAIYLDNINNGYIFTGPSGVGKSTHINLLKDVFKEQLTIINDDKPFVDSSYHIYGSPWSGKSHISNNVIAKLKGIFILYQAKDNKLERLEAKEAINYLIKQIYIPKGMDESNKGLDFLINLVKDIPVYYVGLNLDEDAYKVTSDVMLGE